jgi:hypothetical protein
MIVKSHMRFILYWFCIRNKSYFFPKVAFFLYFESLIFTLQFLALLLIIFNKTLNWWLLILICILGMVDRELLCDLEWKSLSFVWFKHHATGINAALRKFIHEITFKAIVSQLVTHVFIFHDVLYKNCLSQANTLFDRWINAYFNNLLLLVFTVINMYVILARFVSILV